MSKLIREALTHYAHGNKRQLYYLIWIGREQLDMSYLRIKDILIQSYAVPAGVASEILKDYILQRHSIPHLH